MIVYMRAIDLTNILKRFSSGWVAVSDDYKKVVAWGRTLASVTKKVKEKGNPLVVLMAASKNYRGYVTLDL